MALMQRPGNCVQIILVKSAQVFRINKKSEHRIEAEKKKRWFADDLDVKNLH